MRRAAGPAARERRERASAPTAPSPGDAGEAGDFEDVYMRHLVPVWRFVRSRVPDHADAEDVTSEVFARAAGGWEDYDPGRGSVGAWLAGIARNVVADWWRRRGREIPASSLEPPAEPGGASAADPEGAVLHAESAAELRSLLRRLTPREQDAVALRFGAGLPAAEVGSALGISETAARMLVYRAVSKLRREMLHG